MSNVRLLQTWYYLVALDATKEFDSDYCIKLFHRLFDLGLPVYVIRLVINWYANNVPVVEWDNCFAFLFILLLKAVLGNVVCFHQFCLISVLIQLDCLTEALTQSDLSCHVRDVYFGCLCWWMTFCYCQHLLVTYKQKAVLSQRGPCDAAVNFHTQAALLQCRLRRSRDANGLKPVPRPHARDDQQLANASIISRKQGNQNLTWNNHSRSCIWRSLKSR